VTPRDTRVPMLGTIADRCDRGGHKGTRQIRPQPERVVPDGVTVALAAAVRDRGSWRQMR